MIGISVSLYDKFEDLDILMDIVRSNWDEPYYISVCSNHPDADERLAALEHSPDEFQQGAQIRLDNSLSKFRYDTNFTYRVYDSIGTAVRGAYECESVEHVMHVHADAWQLSETGLKDLLEEMDQRNAAVAFKSDIGFRNDAWPPGRFMDQFICFDAAAARRVDLYEHSPLEFPPMCSNHQILPILCLGKFGWSKLYRYSNRFEEEYWDGTPLRGRARHPRDHVGLHRP